MDEAYNPLMDEARYTCYTINYKYYKFTLKPLQINVTINMICKHQQPIKCIFKLLLAISDRGVRGVV